MHAPGQMPVTFLSRDFVSSPQGMVTEIFWMSSWHSSEDEVQSPLVFFTCLIFLEFFLLPESCVCAGIWFGWLCPSVLVLQLCALPTLLWQ